VASGRFALVIAADNFEDPDLRRLVSPQADAEALAGVLADPNIGRFEVRTLVNKRSYEVSRTAEEFFSNRHRDDLLLLYYTGHGLKDDLGQLYFAMPDTNRSLLGSTAFAARFVNDLMSHSRSRTKVLFLDCCHSGAFARGMLNKADRAVHTAERFEGQGRIVLTASDAMQYAFEGDDLTGKGVRSVFTRFLTEGLTTGQADLNGDGEVDLDELYDYVYERVIIESPAQQPHKWAWDVAGRVVIAKSPAGATALPTELQAALESAFAGIRLGAVEVLASMLQGRDMRLVEAATAALRACMDDDSRRVSEFAARLLAGERLPVLGTGSAQKAPAAPALETEQAAHEPALHRGDARDSSIRPTGVNEPEMILIPGGEFYTDLTKAQLREINKAEKKLSWTNEYSTRLWREHWPNLGSMLDVPAFQIAKFPITNGDYARFVAATGRFPPQHWDGLDPPTRLRDHPVVWVSWAAANAYCEWLRAEIGLPFRLPTSFEWEKAARGVDGRTFPWGNGFDRSRCRFKARSTVPVTTHAPAGDSPFEVSDMVGNAREWTSKEVKAHSTTLVVRGGGFLSRSEQELWCTYRDVITGGPKASIGFRVALSQ
jgi:formylglycine-generating enzyme required for sulfatase activity